MLMTKRCLIVEDDAVNADYIASSLSQYGYEVELARDGEIGLDRMLNASWNLIILDRMLPHQVDGLSLLKAMRAEGKQTPVLVLSALSALDDRVKGLKAGGDDYLIKPFDLPELLARIEALIRRSQVVTEETPELRLGDLVIDLKRSQAQRAGKSIHLQIREFKLLLYLMQHANQIITRSMLLEAVWGYSFDPQTNVIDVQISRLRNKIDKPFDYPLLHTIRGEGYILKLPSSLKHES